LRQWARGRLAVGSGSSDSYRRRESSCLPIRFANTITRKVSDFLTRLSDGASVSGHFRVWMKPKLQSIPRLTTVRRSHESAFRSLPSARDSRWSDASVQPLAGMLSACRRSAMASYASPSALRLRIRAIVSCSPGLVQVEQSRMVIRRPDGGSALGIPQFEEADIQTTCSLKRRINLPKFHGL
jgi:hypothetical protein